MNSPFFLSTHASAFVCMLLIVGLSLLGEQYVLAIAALITGSIFLIGTKKKGQPFLDEREASVQEKAAQQTYAIFTPTLGIMAVLLLLPSQSGLAVFSRGEFAFLEAMGLVFAYLTLFLILIFSVSSFFLNRQLGGGSDQE